MIGWRNLETKNIRHLIIVDLVSVFYKTSARRSDSAYISAKFIFSLFFTGDFSETAEGISSKLSTGDEVE